MADYLGDFNEDSTHYFTWSSNDGSGGSVTRATDGTIQIWKNGDQSTATTTGITDDEDEGGVTGVHRVTMVLTDAVYETGQDYSVVLVGATIDGQTVNAVLAEFSIQNRDANVERWASSTVGFGNNGPQVDAVSIGGETAVLNANDVLRVAVTEVIDTVLAAQTAPAFDNFFDVAGPTGTVNSLPAAIPDAAGGLPISAAGGLDLDTILDVAISTRAVAGDEMALVDDAIESGKYDESTAFPIPAAITVDLNATLGTLTSLAAETRNANVLDAIQVVIAVIESQRGGHTHQPSTGSIFFIAPNTGASHGSGARGGISDPYASVQDAHDNAGSDHGHDLYILVADADGTVTTMSEDVLITDGYALIRAPGRDFVWQPTANNTVAISCTGDGLELSGFQIDDFNGTGSQVGIQITDADFALMHHLWLNATRGDGVNITRGTNCIIQDSHFIGTGVSGSGQGVHIVGTAGTSDDNVICDCHFADTGGDAIIIENGTTNDTEIHHNTIHNAGGWAINVGASSNTAQVHHNVMGNNTSGDITDTGTDTIKSNNVPYATQRTKVR